MTREEQRKFKELKKALPQIIKDQIKTYRLHKRDYIIWYDKNELFFDLLLDIRIMSDGHCVCTSIERIKPKWLDDMLWDFLKMEDNKQEPLSLRAIGAFTVCGSELYKDSYELKKWEVGELEECVAVYLKHFYESIQTASLEDFMDHMEVSPYHKELRKSLTLVHNHEYLQALNYLNDFGDGVFRNGNISINKAIREFCRKSIS